jgi:DNA-binding LacI/PurR family transcriptional regulator
LTELEKELLEQGIPTVILGMVFDSLDKYPHATYVTLDNRASARLAVGYLHGEFHHMRIAHLAGPASRFSAKERLDGYRSALLEYGLDTAHIFEPDADNWYQISGYESMRRLTQRCQEASRPLPTAIFAANDFIAWGAIRYLEESGRRVPQDVSVIGHDAYPIREATGLTSAVTPITLLRLTSIDHRLKDYGAVGLQMLRSLAEGRPALPISLAPHLVEGDTCQEAPTDHENGLGLA